MPALLLSFCLLLQCSLARFWQVPSQIPPGGHTAQGWPALPTWLQQVPQGLCGLSGLHSPFIPTSPSYR